MSAIKYILPSSTSELDKLIQSAVKAVNTGRNKLQIACVAILYHAHKHGDYSAAGNTVLSLADSGVRRDTLVEWFKIYGGLQVNDDPETKGGKPFNGWKGADHIKAHFEEAKENMWWLAKAEQDPFVDMSLESDLSKLLSRYGKQLKKAEAAGSEFRGRVITKITQETLDQLLAIADHEPVVESKDSDIMAALEGMIQGPDSEGDSLEAANDEVHAVTNH